MDLTELRKKIDETDREIARLLSERMAASEAIGKLKSASGTPVRDKTREAAVIDHAASAGEERFSGYIKNIYNEVIASSRLYQLQNGFTYGLVGESISASLSPYIHSLFGDYSYRLAQMDREDFLRFMAMRTFRGINVTMPYKKTAMTLCDEVSDTAKRCGCVNTIVNDGGILRGYNTDAYGFLHSIRRYGIGVKGKKCLILGSGGSSGTVRYVLESLGAESITVISRSGEDNYENIARHSDAGIIVNTTPVGMTPDESSSPVDLGIFPQLTGVCDIVYKPLRTSLYTAAKERGIPCFCGMDMLVSQAWAASLVFRGICSSDLPDVPEGVCGKVERYAENIVLIGMPGCGKSSTGRRLSRLLGRDLFDSDEHVLRRTGKSPEELIRKYGEKYFRGVETESIRELSRKTHAVIACGGGAVLREENRKLLRQCGTVIYLKRDLEELSTRGRPLSSSREAVALLYEERREIYEATADLVVAGQGGVQQTAFYIIEALGLKGELTETGETDS